MYEKVFYSCLGGVSFEESFNAKLLGRILELRFPIVCMIHHFGKL